jgi:protein tyrosine/serine phosphatase
MTRHLHTRRVALGLVAAAPFAFSAQMARARPRDWAMPVAMKGAPNLFRITDRIYRGAQPNAVGFRNLAAVGVRRVINVRRSVDDAPLAAGTDLHLHHVMMMTRAIRKEHSARVVEALSALRQAEARGPVLMHCTHGADRTGTIMALWRIMYQGWSREAALAEMTQGGFGFHLIWLNLTRYVAAIDLAELKARVEAAPRVVFVPAPEA